MEKEMNIDLDFARKHGSLIWVADDGNAEVEYDYLDTAQEAAEEYVSDGDWLNDGCTAWVTVHVYPRYLLGDEYFDDIDNRERFTVAIPPEEPECLDLEGHNWQAPYEIVGGIKENPGVWGHGGGVYIHEVCVRCGCGRTTDTWAQHMDAGEQGLTSVKYDIGRYVDDIQEAG